jgi:2-amino-4-hydroxy-6-hydroxymethyldihydropteridine diphosphokinase
MPKAYLGLGGNIGERKGNIKEALHLLEGRGTVKVLRCSSYYETAPVGYEEQEWFLNVVAEIETELAPMELLLLCNEVEQLLKRVRLIRWGPRTIDIDILLYEDFESQEEKLTVPHPRMHERAFVMVPLSELAPELKIKGLGVREILQGLKAQQIRKLADD